MQNFFFGIPAILLALIFVRMQLLAVAEEIEQISRSPLTSRSDVDEQLRKLSDLGACTSEIFKQLEELKQLASAICEITQDSMLQADIRDQLNSTVQTTQELNRKIGRLQICLLCEGMLILSTAVLVVQEKI